MATDQEVLIPKQILKDLIQNWHAFQKAEKVFFINDCFKSLGELDDLFRKIKNILNSKAK